jgi:hypothetical protein
VRLNIYRILTEITKVSKSMKKFSLIVMCVAVLAACGNKAAADKAREDSIRMADSIAKVDSILKADAIHLADSIAKAQAVADSIFKADSIAAVKAKKPIPTKKPVDDEGKNVRLQLRDAANQGGTTTPQPTIEDKLKNASEKAAEKAKKELFGK